VFFILITVFQPANVNRLMKGCIYLVTNHSHFSMNLVKSIDSLKGQDGPSLDKDINLLVESE
jgi:hypothetical protein